MSIYSTEQPFILRTLALAIFASRLVGCSTENAPPKPASVDLSSRGLVVETTDAEKIKTNSEVVQADDGVVTMAEAFELTVYPLLVEKCGSCHGNSTSPLFASPTVATGFDELFNNGKVDFIKLDTSRLLLRLVPDKHYCWKDADCDASLVEMKAKLTAWKDAITDGSVKKLELDAVKYTAVSQLLGAAAVNVDNPDIVENPGQITVEAESATLAGGLAAADDPKGSGTKVLVMSAAGQNLTLNFNITVAGDYFVYGLTSSAAAANSQVNASIDGGAATLWTGVVTGANSWQWNKAATAAGAALTANLAVGAHTLNLTRVQNGFKVDVISITKALDFVGATVLPPKVNILKFDMSKAQQSTVAAGTSLEIQVEDYDENSYKFKSPVLRVASGSVKVKGLKILLNGSWSAQNATYLEIDSTVAAPGKILSPAAMIVPKDKGTALDQISVQFEVMQ